MGASRSRRQGILVVPPIMDSGEIYLFALNLTMYRFNLLEVQKRSME